MPANRFNGYTDYGVGIGLRVPHYDHILSKKPQNATTDIRKDHSVRTRLRKTERRTAKGLLDRSMPVLLNLNKMLEAGSRTRVSFEESSKERTQGVRVVVSSCGNF